MEAASEVAATSSLEVPVLVWAAAEAVSVVRETVP